MQSGLIRYLCFCMLRQNETLGINMARITRQEKGQELDLPSAYYIQLAS